MRALDCPTTFTKHFEASTVSTPRSIIGIVIGQGQGIRLIIKNKKSFKIIRKENWKLSCHSCTLQVCFLF